MHDVSLVKSVFNLTGFAKTADALQLKSGVVEGTYYDEKGIQVIATIPSREELLSKFLGSIQSPVTNFARVIKQIAVGPSRSGTSASNSVPATARLIIVFL